MTFTERYKQESTWQGKAIIMSLYHRAMTSKLSEWTITKTATEFECSIGLVSENIKLADAIDAGIPIHNCNTRQEALTKLNGRYR